MGRTVKNLGKNRLEKVIQKSAEGKKRLVVKSSESKRAYIKQSEIPKLSLEKSLKIAQALNDDFGGKPTAPYNIAEALGISPTSSGWQPLCGSSIGYGLTVGGYNAQTISLTDLGKRIVAPTEDGQDDAAKVEAALNPSAAKQFFDRYNRSKFPQEKIAKNVLKELGVPQERVDNVFNVILENGKFVGIIRETKTGLFVATDDLIVRKATEPEQQEKIGDGNGPKDLATPSLEKKRNIPTISEPANRRIFIAHGKNKEIVNHLKEMLTFGKFIPVVAEEHETTSQPVPEKVFADMRTCKAGVIHIEGEEILIDGKGNKRHTINENVLIEIGAAIALYGDNYILLVHKDIHLPSNLQGLYKCEYSGEKLDVDETMKLLKMFNDFKLD